MAILHKNITASGDIHNPKWHPDANNGDYAWKNEKGELESIDELLLPAALNFVDGSVAPPTSNTNDIYILSSGGSVNAGWGSVALQDWVKYDGAAWNAITPQKSSLCYDKTADSLMSFDGAAWAAIGGASGAGVFGITNSLGEYTYYATVQNALAGASSGDTIEQFSNVSVSTSTSITFDKDITWNMNGYLYENTSTSVFNMLAIANSTNVNLTINNGYIKRSTSNVGTNGGVLLYAGNSLTNKVISNGVTYENIGGTSVTGFAKLFSGIFRSSSTTQRGFDVDGSVYNVEVFSYASNYVNNATFIIELHDSNLYSELGVNQINNVNVFSSTFISDGNIALKFGGGTNKIYNSTGISTASVGIYVANGELHNCSGFSTANHGIQLANSSAVVYNSIGKSTANNGFHVATGGRAYNCFAESAINAGVRFQGSGIFKNGVAKSTGTSIFSQAVFCDVSGAEVTNCDLIVTTASNNCISSTGLKTVKLANNTYKGSTVAVNSNITNSITNTQDNQGNILI